jgi:uncharacterized membrane protein YheB (UPF0754 family)
MKKVKLFEMDIILSPNEIQRRKQEQNKYQRIERLKKVLQIKKVRDQHKQIDKERLDKFREVTTKEWSNLLHQLMVRSANEMEWFEEKQHRLEELIRLRQALEETQIGKSIHEANIHRKKKADQLQRFLDDLVSSQRLERVRARESHKMVHEVHVV